MVTIAGDRTYRRLGELTDTHPETVRRYLQGQAPSAEFLTRLCQVFGINGEWLLTGRGPMKLDQIRAEALREADSAELLQALSKTVAVLIERVERLEVFVQTLDTRLRVASTTIAAESVDRARATPLQPRTDGRPVEQRADGPDRVGDAVSE